MKKTSHTLMLIAMMSTFLSAFTCHSYPDYEDENHHYKIYFENCCDKSIVIWSAIDTYWYVNPCKMYVPFNKLWRYDNEGQKINPGRIDGEYMKHEGFYESWFKDGDSMFVAVFDAERMNKNDTLRFLVSYLLSLNDLVKVNFHLTYPPTEVMKDVHMWPPYDEAIQKIQPGK